MNYIENGIYRTNISFADTHKSSDALRPMVKFFITYFKVYLYCTKCSEINICNPNLQKYVFYKKWCKYFVYSLTQIMAYGEIFLKVYFKIFIFARNIMKLAYSIQKYKNMFLIQDRIKDYELSLEMEEGTKEIRCQFL